MPRSLRKLRRAILPAAVFALVASGHYVIRGLYPARDAIQDRWVSVGPGAVAPWIVRYVRSQEYWMGLSLAMSGSFVVWAVRRWRAERRPVARNAALGGLSLSGVLAAAGCFLTGCCGSPMLAVYVGLLGAWFLPWVKPFGTVFTGLSLLVGWRWVNGRLAAAAAKPCTDPSCRCHPKAPN